jgi:hypothetical protein
MSDGAREPEVVDDSPFPWEGTFISSLRTTANVALAARMANISRQRVYQRRGESARFRAEWDEALDEALDLLEAEMVRRAFRGIERPVLYQGRQVMVPDANGNMVPLVERTYSDRLAIFLSKAYRPEKFRERVSLELEDPIESMSKTLKMEKERLRLAAHGGALLRAMQGEDDGGDDEK